MLDRLPLAALNHLLGTEDWARKHLGEFSGQTVRLVVPPLELFLEITAEGLFRSASKDNKATVTLTLPGDLPLRILGGAGDRGSLLASAQISGSADLADCLGFVFRNLAWDAEGDLAPFVGDIAARRLVQGAQAFVGWQSRMLSNLTRNFADYLREEQPALVTRHEVSAFRRQFAELEAKLSSVERRIASLDGDNRRTQ